MASSQPPHVAFVGHAIADHFGDGDHLHVVLAAKLRELRHPRHGAVVVHDLADNAGRNHAGQARQIDGSLSLSSANQHSAFAGAQRENVSGTRQVVGTGRGIDGDADGLGSIIGRNSGADAILGVDGFGERGAEIRGVLGRHLSQPQIFQALLGHRQANQPAPVLGHKVDGLRRNLFGGHGEVAFVFAVLVVNDHDHAAGADFLQRGLNVAEGRLSGHIDPDENFNREGCFVLRFVVNCPPPWGKAGTVLACGVRTILPVRS